MFCGNNLPFCLVCTYSFDEYGDYGESEYYYENDYYGDYYGYYYSGKLLLYVMFSIRTS